MRQLLNLAKSWISSRARRCPLAIILQDHEGLSLAISSLLTQCFEHCQIPYAHHLPCFLQLLSHARFVISAAHLAVLPLPGGRSRCCAWSPLACVCRWGVGGKQRERGGGDKPPVPVDRIELPDSRVEGLVAMGPTVFVCGGKEEGEQRVDGYHFHQLPTS